MRFSLLASLASEGGPVPIAATRWVGGLAPLRFWGDAAAVSGDRRSEGRGPGPVSSNRFWFPCPVGCDKGPVSGCIDPPPPASLTAQGSAPSGEVVLLSSGHPDPSSPLFSSVSAPGTVHKLPPELGSEMLVTLVLRGPGDGHTAGTGGKQRWSHQTPGENGR